MSRADRSLRATGVSRASSLGTLLAAALVPKCPLCVAAMLSALGLGTGVVGVLAPVVRPLVFTLAATALVALVWREWRRFGTVRRRGAHATKDIL